MKKKVLFINRCLTGGGSEKAMALIANYFADIGYDVSMLLLDERPRTYDIDERIKITECYCPIKGNKLVWHLKRIKTIRELLKKSDAKTVISFMWDINMNVILAAFGLKKKIIVSERCDPRNEPRRIFKIVMHTILPLADVTVFQTEYARRCYPKNVQDKSCIIPNALSPDIPEVNRMHVDKTIVSVGRLVEQKNFRMLLDAFAEFCDVHPDYKLVIYGEGPLKEKLNSQIRMLGISSSVVLPGYVYDVNERMKTAAMYVNSSNYEGISNAMLEAMALGVPPICTDCPVGGARDTIKNGENGVLVPVNDIEKMVLAMNSIADDGIYASKISENASKVRKKLNINEIGKKWAYLVERYS